jgi:hypothetical protein
MWRYQLITGKTIVLKDEDLFLSDEDFEKKIQGMLCADMGVDVDDPFIDLKVKEFPSFNIPDLNENIEDIPDQEIENIKREFNERDE